MRDGYLFGVSASKSGAGDPTPRQAEERLRELVSAFVVVADGVDEVINACLDLGGDVVDPDGTDGGQPEPDNDCLLYTSPSPREKRQSRMPSSA